MIYKMFGGTHIDLSKVVFVSAISVGEDDYGGFHVHFQHVELPIHWCETEGLVESLDELTAAAPDTINLLLDKDVAILLEHNGARFTMAHSDLLAAWQSLMEKAA